MQLHLSQEELSSFLHSLEEEPEVSVRYNPFKPIRHLSSEQARVKWSSAGYYLSTRPPFTFDPHFHAGGYYVQEASSMFLEQALRQIPNPSIVLDLCAAPGGKSTLLRSLLPEGSFLVSNEPVRKRAQILAENIIKWGHEACMVTCNYPDALGRMGALFDLIVADVPCSGEGMFRKDEDAVRQWSADTVGLCCARQKRILADVWPALKGGGLLIYSTCTFNNRENDGNVQWIKESLGAEVVTPECPFGQAIKTLYGYSLAPGFAPGEGQYCAALKKTEYAGKREEGRRRESGKKAVRKNGPEQILKSYFSFDAEISERNGTLIAVPSHIAEDVAAVASSLRTLSSGVKCGCLKNDKLVPDEDLILNAFLKEDAFPTIETDRQTALAYLHRDTIVLGPEVPRGYVALKWKGVRYGVVNNLGNRCNNLHPMSRRILMRV